MQRHNYAQHGAKNIAGRVLFRTSVQLITLVQAEKLQLLIGKPETVIHKIARQSRKYAAI